MAKKKIKYEKRSGFQIKGDIQTIGERIEALSGSGGDISPQDVVNDARNPKSPLHNEFEWDDTEAAKQYRLEQARYILRSYSAVWVEESVEVKSVAMVSLEADNTAVYRSSRKVLSNKALREKWKEQALRELRTWRAKYAAVKELAEVFKAVDKII
jgi:hypothetical protein